MAIATPAPERAAGRRKLAKKRQALPDGSFPMPNVSYLKKAIRAVGRAAPGKRPALAALIRKRARQLGPAGMSVLQGSWADNSRGARAMANALYDQFIELSYTPELAKAEVKATMAFMVREFATPVVSSTDGPKVTTLASGSTKTLVSKESVHYRDASTSGRRCGTCGNMLPHGRCKIVAGTVKPDDVCDRWSAKSSGYANTASPVNLAKLTPAQSKPNATSRKAWDPDADGDNDSSPSGDVDNDYAGKLNPLQRAAMKKMIAKGMPPKRAYQLALRIKSGTSKAA